MGYITPYLVACPLSMSIGTLPAVCAYMALSLSGPMAFIICAMASSQTDMMNMSVSALTSARLVVYVAATLSASSLADCSVRLYTCVISLPLALKACARCVFPVPGGPIKAEHFHVPYADRFEEGEFRKRIQFMFGGELRIIKFLYKGLSIEAILDRFPTAEILQHDDNGWLVKAEVYGDGVDIWLRGQGDLIEVVDGGKRNVSGDNNK